MSLLDLSLGFAALLIGLTGAWSPCGFSMVETIGLSGEPGRRWTVRAACATFALGAVAGGIVTFGLLALLGDTVHGVGGRVLYSMAGTIAVAAAVAEARGLRIAPQIRRQLPEGWRWTLPLPLASALYGGLLGLGFTTFVLSFGVWALAGISFAVGAPGAGLAIGAAFGIGRAIPVVLVAPSVDRPFGARCVQLMAERPVLYRRVRVGDAFALSLVAATLSASAIATGAQSEADPGADPSAAHEALAYQLPDRQGILRAGGFFFALPGDDPAIGGPYAAVIFRPGQPGTDEVRILDRKTQQVIGSFDAPGVQAVAISDTWLAYLTFDGVRYALKARRIDNPAEPGDPSSIASVAAPAQIGHPSLDGARLFYSVSKARRNLIRSRNLKSGKWNTVIRSRTATLTNPAVSGRRFIYVLTRRAGESPQATHPRRLIQHLMIKRVATGGRGRRLFAVGDRRRLWSTSLSGSRAFVTVLRAGGGPKIVSVQR